MLEILKFIFSSFWVFLGFIIILIIILDVLENIIISISKKTKTIKEKQKPLINREETQNPPSPKK